MQKQLSPERWLKLYYGTLKKTVLVRQVSKQNGKTQWGIKLYHRKSGLEFYILLELLSNNKCLAKFADGKKSVLYYTYLPAGVWNDFYQSFLIKTLLKGTYKK